MEAKKEIEELPLKMKLCQEKLGTIVLSESALRKDWLKAEEEEAWRDL
ncbi:DUF2281 domain-containing protein [Candidatus Poribacteria bacterium]